MVLACILIKLDTAATKTSCADSNVYNLLIIFIGKEVVPTHVHFEILDG